MGTDDLKLWRDSLISDKGNLLIDASKRILGSIKTPFNKHELASKLEAYLRRPQTIETMISLLDSMDLRILAILKHTGEMSPDTLAHFAAARKDRSGLENAKARINLLRERLILFLHPGNLIPNSASINPILRERLDEELSLARLVSPLGRQRPSAAKNDFFSDLCVLLSVAVHIKPFFGKSDSLSKKAAEALSQTCPYILEESPEYLSCLYATLLRSGCVIETEKEKAIAKPRTFLDIVDAYGDDTPLAFLTACGGIDPDFLPMPVGIPLFRALVEHYPREVLLSREDACRILLIIIYSQLNSVDEAKKRNFDSALPVVVSAIFDTLRLSRLIEAQVREAGSASSPETCFFAGECMERMATAILRKQQRRIPRDTAPDSPHSSLIVEESHEIRLLPEADIRTKAFIAVIARLDKLGLVWSATLDKNAALSSFAFGFKTPEIIATLESLSGRKLSQSMLFSLESWEKEYNAVRIRHGIVVALDDHLSMVLEHNPKAEGLIREKLADGIYLLDAASLQEAEKDLKRIGIHVDLRGSLAEEHDSHGQSPLQITKGDIEGAKAHRDGYQDEPPPEKPFVDLVDRDDLPDADARTVETIKRLLAELQSLELDPVVEELLADKIKSRLITSKEQMIHNDLGGGGTAGGLDYPGKVRLAERAYKERSPIEIAWIDDASQTQTASGLVRQLNKTETGLELLLATSSTAAHHEKLITITIRSVSRIRMLQNFLFGENHVITTKR